jgi:hypothetical protein
MGNSNVTFQSGFKVLLIVGVDSREFPRDTTRNLQIGELKQEYMKGAEMRKTHGITRAPSVLCCQVPPLVEAGQCQSSTDAKRSRGHDLLLTLTTLTFSANGDSIGDLNGLGFRLC